MIIDNLFSKTKKYHIGFCPYTIYIYNLTLKEMIIRKETTFDVSIYKKKMHSSSVMMTDANLKEKSKFELSY